MKKTRGFSYIEVIIAMALFAIAMLAVIPALSQAGRNMVFAEDAYAGHLQAQHIMHIVRDALLNDGASPQAEVAAHVSNDVDYSVWIRGRDEQEFHTIAMPDADAQIGNINVAMAAQVSVIVVVVWGADGQVMGRAVGMVNYS